MRTKKLFIAFIVMNLVLVCLLESAFTECCIVYNCDAALYRHVSWRVCPMGLPYFCEYDVWKEECDNAGCIQGINCGTVTLKCTLYGGPPVRRGGTCDGQEITCDRIYYVNDGYLCDDIFNCFYCPDGGIPQESTDYLPCSDVIYP